MQKLIYRLAKDYCDMRENTTAAAECVFYIRGAVAVLSYMALDDDDDTLLNQIYTQIQEIQKTTKINGA